MFGRSPRLAALAAAAVLLTLGGCAVTHRGTPDQPTSQPPPTAAPHSPTATEPAPSTYPRHAPEMRSHPSHVPVLPSKARPTSRTSTRGSLPLSYSTGSATQVITVTAGSTDTTTATLQPWTKTAGGTWVRHGSSVLAHVGADGLTNSMSEFISATPMGSFSLTQAFGRLSNPGTPLPYFRTTPADWWISQAGPVYNTHQRCTSGSDGNGCGYKAPSEHLYYETPYYNYAVVIDQNRFPAVYPHGSAVFLHVYPPGTGATAGCVSIPQANLVPIMQWLNPSDHPRILIGVA